MQRRKFLGAMAASTLCHAAPSQVPLRLGMAGLEHGHASGFLARYRDSKEIELVGVSEPIATSPIATSSAPASTRRRSILRSMRCSTRRSRRPWSPSPAPPAISQVVQACAARKIPVMMEKPLAVGIEQARAIEQAAVESGIPVLVNYETTWYASNHAAYALAKENALGEIRKVVIHDGHRGPKEIGVQPEFLAWLDRPGEERRRGPVRLRLLRRQPDDLAHGRRSAGLRDRRDPADQARDLSEGGRRGDDRPGVSRCAGDHPGVVELAVRPQGHGDLWPHRPGPDGGP